MKNTTLLLVLPLLFLIQSCSTPRYASPAEAEEARICFGRGGGYTGMVSEYTLLPNGQIFKKSADDKQAYIELKSVKKKEAKQAFNNYDFLKMAEVDFRHPGNMYYYIRYEHEGQTHEIVWGDEKLKVSPNVKLFYNILAGMVKNQQ